MKKKLGRPKGSSNKPKDYEVATEQGSIEVLMALLRQAKSNRAKSNQAKLDKIKTILES